MASVITSKPATHDHFKGPSALLVERDTPFLHKTDLSENVLSSKSKWLLPPALCLYRFFQIHHA